MYKDKVNLFKKSKAQMFIIVFCLISMLLSVVFILRGNSKYKKDVARSSSPVGSTLKFAKSKTDLTISGIYTDEANSVLIARLTPNDKSKIPYKGEDYAVYLSSKSLNNYTDMKTDILFGKLGVDGDFFLVIPKPINEIYTVAIRNTKYLSSIGTVDKGALQDIEDKKEIDESTKSVTNMISQIKPDLDGEIDSKYNDSINSNSSEAAEALDMIAFRIGLTTAKKDAKHTPIVLKGQLLKGTEFQFEDFFNQVFKDEAIKQAKKTNEEYDRALEGLNERLKDYDERLLIEPDSGDTIAAKKETEQEIEQIKLDQDALLVRLNKYQELQYTEDFFANLQNKATVIDATKYKATRVE